MLIKIAIYADVVGIPDDIQDLGVNLSNLLVKKLKPSFNFNQQESKIILHRNPRIKSISIVSREEAIDRLRGN